MLSDNLKSLRDRLDEYADSGLELAPAGVVGVCSILDAAIDDAQALESCTVPVVDQFPDGEVPENVVRLARKLDRAGVRVGAGPRPGGGDAA